MSVLDLLMANPLPSCLTVPKSLRGDRLWTNGAVLTPGGEGEKKEAWKGWREGEDWRDNVSSVLPAVQWWCGNAHTHWFTLCTLTPFFPTSIHTHTHTPLLTLPLQTLKEVQSQSGSSSSTVMTHKNVVLCYNRVRKVTQVTNRGKASNRFVCYTLGTEFSQRTLPRHTVST